MKVSECVRMCMLMGDEGVVMWRIFLFTDVLLLLLLYFSRPLPRSDDYANDYGRNTSNL